MTTLFDQSDEGHRPLTDTYEFQLLGVLALRLGRVDRATYHEDGRTRESVTDHTVMLGLVATAFAARYYPQLDLGLIAQFALVHDLVEVHAGDVNTLRDLPPAERKDKHAAERAAHVRLGRDLYPVNWPYRMIEKYEQKATPEARFVWAMDKLLPKITHIQNGGQTIRDAGMTRQDVADRYEAQEIELRGIAPEFPELYAFRTDLLGLMGDRVTFASDIVPIDAGTTNGEPR